MRGIGKEGVAESSPTPVVIEETGAMVLWSEKSAEEEESLREKGGSGFGEDDDGLEPLEDLLKRVSESYNPKRKKSSGVKIPGTARSNKKRNAASSIPVETPPTRGRAIKKEEEEVEVVTPKAKKIKTSKKKSPSKTKSAKPSTLAKRTRSAMKSRKVKVVEEEESGEEEESDEEKDKTVKFGKRTILKCRLLRDLEEEGMMMLLEKLQLQG
ncbi:uncharacterized protein [Nicotiana tomentosiformis]|uniref:uncharacterized protein n=1 Tax=Nicotiana tomentosiformis TaxID=4098 RepID=UPI00388CAAC2